jgi:hypothetical protein
VRPVSRPASAGCRRGRQPSRSLRFTPRIGEPDDRPALLRSILAILVHHCRHKSSNIPSVRENPQSTSHTRRRHVFALSPGDRKILWPPTPVTSNICAEDSRSSSEDILPPGPHMSPSTPQQNYQTPLSPTIVPNFLFLVAGAATYEVPSSVPPIGFFPRRSAASSPG